jgi:hypothetical protein
MVNARDGPHLVHFLDFHLVTSGFQGFVDTCEEQLQDQLQQRFFVNSINLSRTARFERLNSSLSRGTGDLGSSTRFIGGMPWMEIRTVQWLEASPTSRFTVASQIRHARKGSKPSASASLLQRPRAFFIIGPIHLTEPRIGYLSSNLSAP